VSISIKIDSKGVERMFGEVAKTLEAAIREETVDFAKRWQREVSTVNIGPGGKGNWGGSRLHNRKGDLRRSVRFYRGTRSVRMVVGGKDAPHAVTHELGGTITPRRGKYLTVPLPSALANSGALSGKYRIRPVGGGKYATDAGPTFIFKSRAGNLIVGVNRKGRKKFDAKRDSLYVLKKSVQIPARLRAWETAKLDSPIGTDFRRRVAKRVNLITGGR
jgi:hypothetical protein